MKNSITLAPLLLLLLRGIVDTDALISADSIATFISKMKTLVGTGYDFFKTFGFRYEDVYKDQLAYQAVNTYENDQQRQEEIKQEELLRTDQAMEQRYFIFISVMVAIIAVTCVLNLFLQIQKASLESMERKKQKVINDYTRDTELRASITKPE